MSVNIKKRNKKITLPMLIVLAMLIAIEIVLSRFLSFAQWNIKFSFAFIPVVVAAILYGPIASAAVGGISDFLGAILFPIGPYFPGFTLTAVITGVIYGLFLHKKQTLVRIISASVTVHVCCSWLLNSFWIWVLYAKSSYPALLATRAVQTVVMTVVTVIVISVISLEIVPKVKTSMLKTM
ncbi:MAG: folate family ECF transporter S component [Clostridiales bacterium]|nr:folate family ECF transporter S component [Clostridiales bacterium]